MEDIRLQQSNHVKYFLKSEVAEAFELSSEPVGWEEDKIEYIRHKDYHGIMTSFTGELSFYKRARKYIKDDFKALGINSKLQLLRYKLKDDGNVVRWVEDFVGIIDYSTYNDTYDVLKVKFNSNEIEELLRTRESDEFELERTSSIEGIQIGELETNLVRLDGVLLASETKMDVIKKTSFIDGANELSWFARGFETYQGVYLRGDNYIVPVLEMLTDTDDRISTPDTADPTADPASKMFFVDSIDPNVDIDTLLNIKISFKVNADITNLVPGLGKKKISVKLVKYQYNEISLQYDELEVEEIGHIFTNDDPKISTNITVEGQRSLNDIAYNQGYMLAFKCESSSNNFFYAKVKQFSINVAAESSRTATDNCEFIFVHDALSRLIKIMTGSSNRFLSKLFGRVEDGYNYDGEYGLIGLISGFWIRQFNSKYDIYKSMSLSIKDLIDSLNAVFNTGLGIELIDGVKKIVIEDLKYFYQDKVVITLNQEIGEPDYKTIKEDYFSTLEFGYDKGGDYNNAVGLDEPNVLTSYATPINRNKQKYRKVSKIRADDVGMEIIRRKPASLNPDEDTSQDDNNWFLDLKRDGSGKFIQKTWLDRLNSIPLGLSYAEDFKGALFTPLRMMFRHGWIIRSGLEQAINLKKFITVIKSKANQRLGMFYRGDNSLRYEGDDLLVSDLPRSIVLPMEVKFKYPISEELIDLINGKTLVNYQNQEVLVPNYYFKFEWTNREGQKERGFLTELKPSTNEITFILANDNII